MGGAFGLGEDDGMGGAFGLGDKNDGLDPRLRRNGNDE